MIPIEYHPLESIPQAYNYVKDSWLKSFHSACKHMICCDFWIAFDPIVRMILDNNVSVVRVTLATLEGDPDTYVGWIAADKDNHTLYYMYVTRSFRNQGVATRLLKKVLIGDSRPGLYHATQAGRAVIDKVFGSS